MIELWELQHLLAEMQARLDDPIPHRRPFLLELDYPLARSGQSKTPGVGNYYKLTADLTPEGFEVLMHQLPSGHRLKGIFWLEAADREEPAPKPKKKAKPKQEPGPHGKMWQELFLAQFFNVAGVREAVHDAREAGDETMRVLLRRVFGVDSLSREAGPEKIYERFPAGEFPQVETMVAQAIRKSRKEQYDRT